MGLTEARWLLSLLASATIAGLGRGDRGDYIGCYRIKLDDYLNTHTGQSVDACLLACQQVYYKYAVIGNHSTCFCGNLPGQFQLPSDSCSTTCPKNSTQKCGGENAASVYDTEVSAPGPPSSFKVVNFTETTVRVHWSPPQAFSMISGYVLKAIVLHTYSDIVPPTLEWKVSNDTFSSELLDLQPGSTYNISVAAINQDETGPNVTTTVETEIGTPDPSPPEVKYVDRKGDRMVIHIPEAQNNNGPVSRYRIVVSIELYQQGYIVASLSNYTYATDQGLPYYITAEIDPEDIKDDFIIGDRSTYNGFYNAPLPLTNDIDVSLGVVSEKNSIRKIRYADAAKRIILHINELEKMSPMVMGLGAGIGICVVLLLIGVGLLIILRKKVEFTRLQRGSQSMPLSLSEPCVEIENAGFLQEEDERVDYYGNLKRKLWNIPRNLIDIDKSYVGLNSFGSFTKGKVQQHGGFTSGLVLVIDADREFDRSKKRHMLHELDLLIKTSEHENILSLIGFCETDTTLYVVLEHTNESLKELLLQARHRDLKNNKFCSIMENNVLQICVDVARGMDYLHSKKIFHEKLSCRNIRITDNGVAKVGGFGLSHMFGGAKPLHGTPDYRRWTSHEMLKQSRFNPKADVWSYGCLFWEALTIGGTPYATMPTKEVVTRVLRGLRLSQPSYVGDELFQICLQCWQVDPDERPGFSSLLHELTPFTQYPATRSISFTHYNGFEFEPYVAQYEVVDR